MTTDHEYIKAKAPEFMERYLAVVSASFLYDGEESAVLPIKYRELITATILSAVRASDQAVITHLRRGLQNGLTEQEVIEAYQAAQMPGGATTFWGGIRCLRAALTSEQ